MTETSYPVQGGAGVNEFTYELLSAQTMGTGRVEMYAGEATTQTDLIYGNSTGRNVKIAANCAYIVRGYRWESGADVLTVPLAANTSGKTRIDRVVLRLDRSTYTVRVAVIQGTPADTPVVPSVSSATTSASGTFEVPIARVTVKSQTGTDLPSITAADVGQEYKELMPPGVYGLSTFRGGTNGIGKLYTETDTGRVYMGAPGGDILIGENGPYTKIAVAGGWALDNIYAQRVNGWTTFEAYAALNVADRAASTDLVLCNLPAPFRPQRGKWFQVAMSPGQVGWGFADGSDGTVKITAYPSTFPKDGKIVVGPIQWPSVGVKP